MAKRMLSSLSVGLSERFATCKLSCLAPPPVCKCLLQLLFSGVGEGFVDIRKDLVLFLLFIEIWKQLLKRCAENAAEAIGPCFKGMLTNALVSILLCSLCFGHLTFGEKDGLRRKNPVQSQLRNLWMFRKKYFLSFFFILWPIYCTTIPIYFCMRLTTS